MPELPEVETVRRGLEPAMAGQRFKNVTVRRHDLRFPVPADFSNVLRGRKVQSLTRRGKYIVVHLDGERGFGLHLGMSGRVRVFPKGTKREKGAHDHIIFEMENGGVIVFNDPRRFGMAFLTGDKWEDEKFFKAMGPEPLEDVFTPDGLRAKLKNKKASIKAALLDQCVVAGVGNIYACEALYDAGIHPARAAGSLTRAEAGKLVKAVRAVLKRAIEAGGSSLRDHRTTDGNLGYFQHSFSVYDREGALCLSCSGGKKSCKGIRRMVQSGRSTFYCPVKQK